jgi:repressor LexA
MNKNLTPKQKKILDFILNYTRRHGFSPTQEEIRRHFDFRSLGHVQHFVVQLKRKGFLQGESGATRGLGGTSAEGAIPLLGRVAAGRPIESSIHNETVDVPALMMKKKGEYFALEVKGDSMIDEGIFEGDYLVLRKQARAENGQIVVASVDGGATVKRFVPKEEHIELHPANAQHKPLIVSSDQNLHIEGLLCGVIRVV